MDWTTAAAAILAYVGQYLKAVRGVPTEVAQAVIALLAIGLYALGNPPTEPWNEWLQGGVVWALAVLGGASLAAGVRVAPKTDSL